MRLQPPAPLETVPAKSGAVSDGPPRQRSGAPPSHLQPVDQGPAFRLARTGLPHGRSRQSSEGPQRSAGPAQRVDGRDRPCVVNALRAQRGPYPVAPPTGLNPPTPLSGEPQFCPQILRKTQKKGGTTTPSQCPRIELDQRDGSVVDDLASEQRALARELVRRSIFIEMEPGLSRHGHVTTVRWHFRRVFLPAFSAALAKNNAIKQPMDWFKFLLTDPQGACDMVWRRWPRKGDDGAVLELFADL